MTGRAGVTDEAIVLRRVDYGEADRVLTLLTKDRGKLGALAKGARKPSSTLSTATDLFVHGRFQLVPGRGELEIVTHGEVIGIREPGQPYDVLLGAGACAEVVDRLMVDRFPDPGAFLLVVSALDVLWSQARPPATAVVWCGLSLLVHLGYAPILDRCVRCHKELAPRTSWYVARLGGLVCADCHIRAPGGFPVDVRTQKLLRLIAKGDAGTFFRVRLDDSTTRELCDVLADALEEHLHAALHALPMLRARLPRQQA
ncbi:MAG: DNA repair protein RecO [Candidatus Dormibacteria bacterium]